MQFACCRGTRDNVGAASLPGEAGGFMRFTVLFLFLLSTVMLLPAQDNQDGPKNEKAQKTYQQALTLAQQHKQEEALEAFKKANKQDDNHCLACQKLIA